MTGNATAPNTQPVIVFGGRRYYNEQPRARRRLALGPCHDPAAVQAISDGWRIGAYDEPPSGAHQLH
jgi:hypothetical protein